MTEIEQELINLGLDLVAHKRRAAYLKGNISALTEQIKAEGKEYTGLVGSTWGHDPGKIGYLQRAVTDLKRKISHMTKPKVVWTSKPGYHEQNYIVHKVTAKRIYVCSPGSTNHGLYNKDGSSVGGRSKVVKIDIEATFGGPCPDKMS